MYFSANNQCAQGMSRYLSVSAELPALFLNILIFMAQFAVNVFKIR